MCRDIFALRHTNFFRLLVDRGHVRPDNVLKVLLALNVFVRVPEAEPPRGQSRRHVLDVVDGRDAEALVLFSQVVSYSDHDGALFEPGVLGRDSPIVKHYPQIKNPCFVTCVNSALCS
jgi:hypothetical protein